MDHDDRLIGRLLTRRETLRLFSGSAALLTAGLALGGERRMASMAMTLPACVVRPELTEGPYFAGARPQRHPLRTVDG